MIISFAWTAKAIEWRVKTETRRFWKDKYAAQFKPLSIHDAYDKSPRAGGKPLCKIRILKVFKQPLSEMSDDSFCAEGGTDEWKNKQEFIEMMLKQGKGDTPWVIEFEYLSVLDPIYYPKVTK